MKRSIMSRTRECSLWTLDPEGGETEGEHPAQTTCVPATAGFWPQQLFIFLGNYVEEAARNFQSHSTAKGQAIVHKKDSNPTLKEVWGNSMEVPPKTKHTTTIWSRKWTLGHLSQRHENLCSYKNLCMNVHHSFIHHSQKLEIVQMSFNRCINCGTFVPWNVLTIKKNELLVHTPTQTKLQEIILIGKKNKPVSKVTCCTILLQK